MYSEVNSIFIVFITEKSKNYSLILTIFNYFYFTHCFLLYMYSILKTVLRRLYRIQQKQFYNKTLKEITAMKKKKWEHLFISPSYRPPLLDDLYDEEGDLNTGRTRGQTYSSNELFESCKAHMGLSWFYEIPEKNPFVGEHVHDVDELIFFMPAYTKKGDDTNVKW